MSLQRIPLSDCTIVRPGDEVPAVGWALRPSTMAEYERLVRIQREEAEAARLHDTDPGRWGDHASPARMKRDIQKDRDEDRLNGLG